MKAKNGDTVRVHYVGRLANGRVFDTSVGRKPLRFTIGQREVISGFERAVPGMEVGDRQNIVVEMMDAYGPHHRELVFDVPRSALPDDLTVHQGQQLSVKDQEGNVVRAFVTDDTPEKVTLDANHPLAGRDLHFEIELADIVQ